MFMLARQQSERVFHDLQARRRSASFRRADDLRFDDDAYLDHETWIRPAFTRLGDLNGRRALDFGCGHGMAAVVMARRGADAVAFDLSADYLREARARAAANGVRVGFVQADGERLPFAAGSFDVVWGNAVLHHLDPSVAGRELARVLRPGGVAVFCEPWGGNPLLSLARRWLPYPGKERTPDERPLDPGAVRALRAFFPELRVEGFQLLAMLRRVLRNQGRLSAALTVGDERLLRAVPALRHWCRYMVLTLRSAPPGTIRGLAAVPGRVPTAAGRSPPG